jgi:regulator of replication initiation timing
MALPELHQQLAQILDELKEASNKLQTAIEMANKLTLELLKSDVTLPEPEKADSSVPSPLRDQGHGSA